MARQSSIGKARAWFIEHAGSQPIQLREIPRNIKKHCYDLEHEGFLIKEEYLKEFPEQNCKRRRMTQYYVDATAISAKSP